MKSVTSGLGPSRSTPDLVGGLPGGEPSAVTAALATFGAGHARKVSEAKLAEAALFPSDGQEHAGVSKLADAPASRATARAGGVADPRLAQKDLRADAKREKSIVGALAALDRITELVTEFHTTPHFGPYDGKTYPLGDRKEKLPRVLAAVTEGLRSLREAAALLGAGQVDPAKHPGFAPAFENFLNAHAALIRGDEAKYGYEQEPVFKDTRARLSTKLTELWGLAPSFVGRDVADRLARQRIPSVPSDLPPVREGARALWEIISGHRPLEYFAPRDSVLRKAAQRLEDNATGVEFYREGGKHAIGLRGVGIWRMEGGRELPRVSAEEVESAARAVLEHSKLDATIPIAVQHPGPTPLRREEAWSVLRQAFDARDFVAVPASGSEYALRRWQPDTFELLPPTPERFVEPRGSDSKSLQLIQYTNGSTHRGSLNAFAEGTPERLEADCRDYLRVRGFQDVHVSVTLARRALSPERAEAMRQRILDTVSAEATPKVGTPEALLRSQVSAVTVEHDPFAERREVVVYTKGTYTWDRERLERIEGAVRALLADDPQAIGAPIRVRLIPEPNSLGHLPEVSSVVFGEFKTEADRQRSWEEYQSAMTKLEQSPGLVGFLLEARRTAVERFAREGPVQAELVRAMRSDLECAREDWRPALLENLTAWFLGEGSPDPAWRLRFEQLPHSQRADLLELSLEFLGDTAQAPALRDALVTFRRLEGRAALEAACTRNGTQSPEQRAHTDAIFGDGLRGPAREAARAAIAGARQA